MQDYVIAQQSPIEDHVSAKRLATIARLDDLSQKICITVARLSGADEASAEHFDMGAGHFDMGSNQLDDS